MKLYIVDKYKLKDYLLPSKVEDSFLINYVSPTGVEESITLAAENGQWTISSNLDMHVIKGGLEITKNTISDSDFYQIKFNDLNEYINLYCFDIPMNYYIYSVEGKTSVTLGRSNCDILYENINIGTPHFEIVRSNNYWILKDNGTDEIITFVNGRRYHQVVLNMGDVIFTNGLKIIWMEDFIKINNPNNAVKLALKKYENFKMLGNENKYTPVKDTEKGIVLFNDNQLFFHTPRLKSTITTKEIEISKPPSPIKDEAPPAILTLGASVIMGISSSVTSVVSIFNALSGKNNLMQTIAEIIVCFGMILGSIFFPILLDKFNKNRIKKKEKIRQNKYSAYLDKKQNEINEEITLQSRILNENNLTLEQIKENIIAKNNKLWNREIFDTDFLSVRLGVGNTKANIKVIAKLDDFSLEDDNLRDRVIKLSNSPLVMNNVPITVSLIENTILPLIISNDYLQKQQFIDSIMLQIISYYSGKDLKIVVITNEDNSYKWEYLKYLPHCCSDDFSIHFFADNEDEMKTISTYLEQEFLRREQEVGIDKSKLNKVSSEGNEYYKKFDNYYLFVTDNYTRSKRLGIIDKIVNYQVNLGFSLLMVEPTMQNIPSKANVFVEINSASGSISGKDLSTQSKCIFAPEILNNTDIKDYAEILANIPILSKSNGASLPTSINFLEMYKVGKIEQLNIMNRWIKSNPIVSLSTPIGVNEEGKLFTLDLHEKFHGPHGLIAGATGSGKSEWIISFILSMAVNYHPYEVQFVLIDYKGGGLAGAFENKETGVKIPHLVGTITNLDTSEMNRTLVSINSELKRRQRMFNEARNSLGESTIDIYKYQQLYRDGKVKEPISHLFIISDEFAELKSQQPDFMDELVSTARIGRSLGVHLILATQKPAGVVNDQIWSNSRFKVCLKVQTAEDSHELLKRPEAASIKETGRFYLQIGYNESFELGQSAWAGAKYNPTDRIIKNIDDSIDFIRNDGTLFKSVNDKKTIDTSKNYGDQLTNIVKTLYEIAKRENIEFKQLWLPSISKEIYLSSIVKKYNYTPQNNKIEAIIGEYDDPKNQLQNLFTINLINGHIGIFGNPGSGKENMIMTMIYSVCIYHNSDEVNFYILDFGAGVFNIFKNIPHVGDIASIDEKDKVSNLFEMLEREINKRKEILSKYNGNYQTYIKSSANKMPLIVVVLNNYESFLENYDRENSYFVHQVRECSKYGVIFILSAAAPSSVNGRVRQLFATKIATQLTDSFDYKMELDAEYGLTPSKNFGRGLAQINSSVYEFQTAFIYLQDNINSVIENTCKELESVIKKAKKIPIVPKIVNSNYMLPYIEEITNVPVGINVYDAKIAKYNFINNKVTYIIGNTLLTETTFIYELINVLDSIPNIKLRIIDFATCLNIQNAEYYNGDFTKTINSIITNDKEAISSVIYILVGVSYIRDKVLDEGVELFEEIFSNLNKYKNSYFIIADNYSSTKKVHNDIWFKKTINKNSGIWIGTGISNQDIFKIDNLTKNDSNEEFEGIGFLINNNNGNLIKTIGCSDKGGSYY